MKVRNRFDLITDEHCFDIHREPYEEIKQEMKVFFKYLKSCESSGQDSYSFGDLFSHSFDVLEQILCEYFEFHEK